MEFGSGVVGAEPPVDGDTRGVALGLVCRDGTSQSIGVGVSTFETGPAQGTEFNLRHVQPTGVFEGVVKLQVFGE